MKKYNIPFSPPDISEEEISEVVDTLKSGWITTGPKTKTFEREIANYCHTEYAACLNSATAALEMALRILGVGPGDEVITTAYTYTASASVVCHVGAKLVLVDTAKDSYEMDYEKLADAITEIFVLFKRCNKYIDETTPWVLAKDEAQQDRLAEVLYNLTESITIGASLLHSFLPESAEKIVAQLNTIRREFDDLDKFGLYESGTKVTDKPEILFGRLKAEDVMPEVEKIQAVQKAEFEAEQAKLAAVEGKAACGCGAGENAVDGAELEPMDVEAKEEITFDDFEKLQFQVGEIVKCEAVAKSKKLLCSQVRIGNQTKQIVSGIRKYYSPEEMVGKKVMVLVNLKPAKLAGVLSEGMLLCAEDAEGNLALLTPEKPMPAGAPIA